MEKISGIYPTMLTPMKDDGAIDWDSIERLIDYMGDDVDGYCVGGSVGESPSLTLPERLALIKWFGERKGSKGMIVGVGDPSLNNSAALIEAAEEAGAFALLAPLPFYFKLTPDMVYDYYLSLDKLTRLQVIIYDNPVPTNYFLGVDEVARIDRDSQHVHHIKITDPRPAKVTEVLAQTGMGTISGEDYVVWRMLKRGVEAHIIAAPMLFPKEFKQVCSLFAAGQEKDAYLIFCRKLLPFMNDSLGAEDFISTLKYALHRRGVFASPAVRTPLIKLDELRRREVELSLEACLHQ